MSPHPLVRFLARLFRAERRPVPTGPAAATTTPVSAAGSDPLGRPADLVGRQSECATLRALVAEHATVFLHGPARIGKTYLMQSLAAQWRLDGRPFLYTCASEQGIGALYRRLGQFFRANGHPQYAEHAELPEANDDDRCLLLADQLTQDRYLLVLDAFEQVAHRPPFQALVRACCQEPGEGRLLVCGRDLPAWQTEQPAARCAALSLGGLSPSDSRAVARRHGFAEADLEGLDRSLHPFLLELLLLAARQRRTSPGALLGRLEGPQLEEALLREVYHSLDGREVLERLSVLRRPFAAAAFPAFGATVESIQEKPLSLLVDRSATGRCALHPLVRRYGVARLHDDAAARRRAHGEALDYYRARLALPGPPAVEASLETAHHLLETGQPDRALEGLSRQYRTIVSFGYGWELLGLAGRIESSGLLARGDEVAEALTRHDLAALHVHLPVLSVADNHLKAIRYSGRAAELFEQGGHRYRQASALNLLGMACSGLPTGDPRQNLHRAFAAFRQALGIYQQLDLPEGRAVVHNNMGAAWMDLASLGGEWCIGRAVGHLKQAVRLYREGVDPYTRALVERNLGHAQCRLGRAEEGMSHFAAALEFFRRDGLPREYADTQRSLGDAHRLASSGRRTSRLTRAIAYYAEALTVYEEEIFPEDFARTQHYLGVAHRQLGVYEDARRHQCLAVKCYRNALRVYTPEEFPHRHQLVRTNLERDLTELDEQVDWRYGATGTPLGPRTLPAPG